MDLATAIAEVARLTAENADLRRQVAELLQTVKDLELRLAEAERKAARPTAPFRKDDDDKVPPAERKRPGRKKGHRGSRRRRPPQVDQEVNVPLDECPHCGGAVTDRTPLTQYIEEIPPVRPTVTRLTTWDGTCAKCGRVHSSHPLQTSRAGGAAAVQLGPRASALALYLKHALDLSARKACRLLKDAFGLSFSGGGLCHKSHRTAQQFRERHAELMAHIRGSPTVYADETSWYVGEPKWWLWVFTTPQGTLYHVDSSHGGPVAERLLGREFDGVLVTDCNTAYDRFRCPQHKCIAHHLVRLKEYAELRGNKRQDYLDAWKALWKDVCALTPLRTEPPTSEFLARVAEIERRADELFAREVTQPGDRKFRTRMERARPHLFTCLKRAGVEATNNRAERALRPAVIARKVSCGNKTPRGAATWATLTSLAVTAAQLGRDLLEALRPAPAG